MPNELKMLRLSKIRSYLIFPSEFGRKDLTLSRLFMTFLRNAPFGFRVNFFNSGIFLTNLFIYLFLTSIKEQDAKSNSWNDLFQYGLVKPLSILSLPLLK